MADTNIQSSKFVWNDNNIAWKYSKRFESYCLIEINIKYYKKKELSRLFCDILCYGKLTPSSSRLVVQ